MDRDNSIRRPGTGKTTTLGELHRWPPAVSRFRFMEGRPMRQWALLVALTLACAATDRQAATGGQPPVGGAANSTPAWGYPKCWNVYTFDGKPPSAVDPTLQKSWDD